jgi:hypothetical protein
MKVNLEELSPEEMKELMERIRARKRLEEDKRTKTQVIKDFLSKRGEIIAVYRGEDGGSEFYVEDLMEVPRDKLTYHRLRRWLTKEVGGDKELVDEVLEELAKEIKKLQAGLEPEEVFVCRYDYDHTSFYLRVDR